MGEKSPASRPELIEARELVDWDAGDAFSHQQIATQLADLAVTVPTPANIALFGPWGSGKTGIGNLLQARLEQEEFRKQQSLDGVKCVRFDAFKYAETPLRRHFLSQVAGQLLSEKSATEYRSKLYQSQVQSKVSFESLKNGRAVGAYLLILGLALFIAMAASLLVACVVTFAGARGDPGLWQRWTDFVGVILGFAFAPAAVLGGLFALAGNTLPITRTTAVPSSDEQFEAAFDDLLKMVDTTRLLVFVDELDRCSPREVVSVLDTIRTFLDVQGTVFIVAADREVLERALSEDARQATPTNLSDPYYSTGSAYLDKVFHYQFGLPELLPGRVTKYALGLVDGREGIWSDSRIDNAWLVSVLVPTHVRSPRRVKTLLNNYVLAFRLTEQRFAIGTLSSSPYDRYLELAKLVALRTEFPRFARELTSSTRMPELLLRFVSGDQELGDELIASEIWRKVRSFGQAEEEVAILLDDTTSNTHNSHETAQALLDQLVAYLQKTHHVQDPHRDLVFLEAQGSLFGLDESLAEEIEDLAINAQTDRLVRSVDLLPESGQIGAVRLLAQRAREAQPGVEGQNLVEVLLALAASRSDSVIVETADEAVDAINMHATVGQLADEGLAGALVLGLRTSRNGRQLIEAVLGDNRAVRVDSLGSAVLANAAELSEYPDALGSLVAYHLLHGADEVLDVLDRVSYRASAVRSAHNYLSTTIEEARREEVEGIEAPNLQDLLNHFSEALPIATHRETMDILNILVQIAFDQPEVNLWTTAGSSLSKLVHESPSDLAETWRSCLRRAKDVPIETAGAWLAHWPGFADDGDWAPLVSPILEAAWERRAELGTEYESHRKEAVEALRAMGTVHESVGRQPLILNDVGVEAIAGFPLTAGDVAEVEEAWSQTRRFAETGCIDIEQVLGMLVDELEEGLTSEEITAADAAGLGAFYLQWCRWVAHRASASHTQCLVNALMVCPWMEDSARHRCSLLVAGDRSTSGNVKLHLTVDDVLDLSKTDTKADHAAVSVWIGDFATDGTDVATVLVNYVSRYHLVRRGVQGFVGRVGDAEAFVVARSIILYTGDAGCPLPVACLVDCRFDEADESTTADLLVAEYERTGTRNQRRRDLMEAWAVLDPQGKQSRRKLIEGITIPTLAMGGKEGYSIVVRQMGLLTNPTDVKTKLKDALRSAAKASGKSRRMEELLVQHQIVRHERTGLLGRKKTEIKED